MYNNEYEVDKHDLENDKNNNDDIFPSILSSSTANISLDVAFGPSVGKVFIKGAFNVSVGAMLTLDCDAGNAAPEVDVVWTKNGDAIEMKQVRVGGCGRRRGGRVREVHVVWRVETHFT